MFRFLSNLFLALAALFALRLVFAAIRRANSRSGEPRPPAPPRADERERDSKPTRAPRIDSSLAEDVPFVEVADEREKVRRD